MAITLGRICAVRSLSTTPVFLCPHLKPWLSLWLGGGLSVLRGSCWVLCPLRGCVKGSRHSSGESQCELVRVHGEKEGVNTALSGPKWPFRLLDFQWDLRSCVCPPPCGVWPGQHQAFEPAEPQAKRMSTPYHACSLRCC